MRRLGVLAVLLALLLVAGCGDDDDGGGGSASGGGSGNFCARAAVFQERFDELDSQFSGDEAPSGEVFEEAAAAISELADGAPGEIRDDLRTIADGVREIAEVFGDLDFSDPSSFSEEQMAELEEVGERMEAIGEEVEAASGRVEVYLEEECGITIDDE